MPLFSGMKSGTIVRHFKGEPQDGTKSEHYMKKIALIICLVLGGTLAAKAQCSPFQGLGATQWFDNNGVVLTNGVLYSFQAGTSTQQATFTDSTCTVANVNPITFNTGARVNIWLTTGNFYKFVLCLQNDGSTCAPADVLFSVDNVPGGSSGGGGGGGSPFISASPNPATAGILRCASGDQCVAFRNAANSANLAISKDSNDVLTWAGGSLKFPTVGTPSGLTGGFSWLWADSTANRWKVSNNGGGGVNLVVSGVDINTSDQVTQLHFGSTATPLSSTAPLTGQCLAWNGTNIAGANCVILQLTSDAAVTGTTFTNVAGISFTAAANTAYRVTCTDYTNATGASVLQLQWTGPASPTTLQISGEVNGLTVSTFGTPVVGGGNGGVGQQYATMALINGVNAGTVQLQLASNTAGQTATLKAGTWCIVQ